MSDDAIYNETAPETWVAYESTARLWIKQETLECRTIKLSEVGLVLVPPSKLVLEPGQALRVDLPLPGFQRPLPLPAVMLRETRHGGAYAVELAFEIPPAARSVLQQFLQQQLQRQPGAPAQGRPEREPHPASGGPAPHPAQRPRRHRHQVTTELVPTELEIPVQPRPSAPSAPGEPGPGAHRPALQPIPRRRSQPTTQVPPRTLDPRGLRAIEPTPVLEPTEPAASFPAPPSGPGALDGGAASPPLQHSQSAAPVAAEEPAHIVDIVDAPQAWESQETPGISPMDLLAPHRSQLEAVETEEPTATGPLRSARQASAAPLLSAADTNDDTTSPASPGTPRGSAPARPAEADADATRENSDPFDGLPDVPGTCEEVPEWRDPSEMSPDEIVGKMLDRNTDNEDLERIYRAAVKDLERSEAAVTAKGKKRKPKKKGWF